MPYRTKIELPPVWEGKDPLTPLWSSWIITVNTNTARREVIRPFREIWETIVQNIGDFMIGRDGGQLLEVREKHSFERGDIYHKVHLHSNVIAHTTGLVYIDPEKLQKYINASMRITLPEYKGCYVNVKIIRGFNATNYIEAYLEKTRGKKDIELE